jgi:hypothetical protein
MSRSLLPRPVPACSALFLAFPAQFLAFPAQFLAFPALFLAFPALFLACPTLFLPCPTLFLPCPSSRRQTRARVPPRPLFRAGHWWSDRRGWGGS